MRSMSNNRLLFLLAILFAVLIPVNGIAGNAPLEVQGEWIAGTIYSHTQFKLATQNEGVLAADDFRITYEIDEENGTIDLLIAEDDGLSENIEAAYIRISEAAHFVYMMIENPVGYFIEQSPEIGDANEFLCYEVELDSTFFFHDGNVIKDGNEKYEYFFLDDKLYITDRNEYIGGCVASYGDTAFMLDTGNTITWHEKYPTIEIWMLFIQMGAIQ